MNPNGVGLQRAFSLTLEILKLVEKLQVFDIVHVDIHLANVVVDQD